MAADIENLATLHDRAVAAGEKTYKDPATGYKVMTSATLSKRGRCCGCGCRHCPYNYENMAMEKWNEAVQPSGATLLKRFEARIAVISGNSLQIKT